MLFYMRLLPLAIDTPAERRLRDTPRNASDSGVSLPFSDASNTFQPIPEVKLKNPTIQLLNSPIQLLECKIDVLQKLQVLHVTPAPPR